MINMYPLQFKMWILAIGITPFFFWGGKCTITEIDFQCFDIFEYMEIVWIMVFSVSALFFWSKYKKQICGCES